MNRPPINKAMGLSLRWHRQATGEDIANVAAAVGYSPGRIKSLEGGTDIEPDEICRLATHYGVSFADVINWAITINVGNPNTAPSVTPLPDPDTIPYRVDDDWLAHLEADVATTAFEKRLRNMTGEGMTNAKVTTLGFLRGLLPLTPAERVQKIQGLRAT